MKKTIKKISALVLGVVAMMKEKIKRILGYLQTWWFPLYLNIALMLVHVVMIISSFHLAYAAGITFHFGTAMMCWILVQYDKEHKKDAYLIHALDHMFGYLWKEAEKQEREAKAKEEQA